MDPLSPVKTGPGKMNAIPLSGSAKAAPIVAATSAEIPPDGGVGGGIDQHLGFDISAYIQPGDMQKWWDSSPYFDAIFYVPGAPSHAGVKEFDAAWVSALYNSFSFGGLNDEVQMTNVSGTVDTQH
jgi:hypothetical protein